ncbi:uncharacterized protein LOC101707766 isoform X2 [Heterocephalus glaber]|uniref:Uncharacterized protein LOC101707766 isoform X2 n=1 Tax=Heterocephalus glaber TaxID=10181 RepID=A0AAX6RDR5_HETGA|nr:uncharacterized protein LOC101707766 isoform X2 [Heterocephalus glaber]XP_021094463.1 uncharacterized protein LOC101707766 isoform X2 [Heterocephalus glaber]
MGKSPGPRPRAPHGLGGSCAPRLQDVCVCSEPQDWQGVCIRARGPYSQCSASEAQKLEGLVSADPRPTGPRSGTQSPCIPSLPLCSHASPRRSRPESYRGGPGEKTKEAAGLRGRGGCSPPARAARSSCCLSRGTSQRVPGPACGWRKPEEDGPGASPPRRPAGGRCSLRSPRPRAARRARSRIRRDCSRHLPGGRRLLLLRGRPSSPRKVQCRARLRGAPCPRAARQECGRAPTFLAGRTPDPRPSRVSRTGKLPRREGRGKTAGDFRTRPTASQNRQECLLLPCFLRMYLK